MSGEPPTGRLVAVTQARSCGATTTSLALALTWSRPVLLAETDPAGGELAARFGRSTQPGLLSLAAASEPPDHAAVMGVAQLLGLVPTVVAPVGAEAAAAAMAALLPGYACVLGAMPGFDVIADCGRLPGGKDGPASDVLAAAHLVVVLARPNASGVVDLRHRLTSLPSGVRHRSVVVLVGDRPYGAHEVADVVGTPVVGTVATDPAAADLLAMGETGGWRLARSALMRSARSLAFALSECIPTGVTSGEMSPRAAVRGA